MSKLRYYFGTMSSSKSATLLMKDFQFRESGCSTILMKPAFDTRDFSEIKSRAIAESKTCYIFYNDTNIKELVIDILKRQSEGKQILFIDECHFMTKEHVKQIWELAKYQGVEVFCYGLKTSYQNTLFEGSKELLIYADSIEEIKSMCNRCENKATTHLRLVNDVVVFDGLDTIVGDTNGTERYESVCQECYQVALDTVGHINESSLEHMKNCISELDCTESDRCDELSCRECWDVKFSTMIEEDIKIYYEAMTNGKMCNRYMSTCASVPCIDCFFGR